MASYASIPTFGAASAFDAGKFAKFASLVPGLAGTTAGAFAGAVPTGVQGFEALAQRYYEIFAVERDITAQQIAIRNQAYTCVQQVCSQEMLICEQAIAALRSGMYASSNGYRYLEAFETVKALANKLTFVANECYGKINELVNQRLSLTEQGKAILASPFGEEKIREIFAAKAALYYKAGEIRQFYFNNVQATTIEQGWIIKQALSTLQATGIFASPVGNVIKQALVSLDNLVCELNSGSKQVWELQQNLAHQAMNAVFAGANGQTGMWSTYNNNNWRMGNFWHNTPFNGTVANNSNLYNVAFRPSNAVEFYSLTNPIRVLDREGNRQLWLCYELKGFKPEEVTVTFNKAERAVVVEAAHEVKEGKEHHILRKFYRKFVLPESFAKIDLSKIELKSCLNAEGFLTIECILPKMTAEEIAKCPIMSKINEMPFYGYGTAAGFNAGSAVNAIKPVTVKTA